MRRLPLFLLVLSSLFPLELAALDVRFHPGEVVYTYEAEPARGLSTVVLQNIAVVQREGGPVTLESLDIQVLSAGRIVQTQTVPAPALDQATQQLAAMDAAGALKLYDFHFQTSRSLGEGIKVAPGRTLAPGTGTLVSGRALLLSGPADEILVLVHARDGAGKPIEARGSIRVAEHRSPNQFHFPLAGTVYVGAAPSLHSHHRWAVPQEFALDLVVLGTEGKTFKGAGTRLDDYYAFGRDILAVADGVVVEAVTDGDESGDRLRQAGESMDAFMRRTATEQNRLLARGPKATIGNYVVIRHEGGEHSQYAHLKQGSVRVRAGDAVKRGQVIGQLGQSGNSTEPHLHFQLTDGPDVLYSRGLPIVFQNVEVMDVKEPRPLQSGWIVTVKE